ncbi:hypothetical protein DC346_09095 [Acinetobacter junii]|uniref:Phage abortive infection protein n=1 Tax=Acinetobacter junii TaxID=40215 RepID=A0A365PJD4_ACIJU|nr:hypothetical protein DDF86_05045 [Acinetobacter junii]RBA40746.1 hypothetical protein DDG62_08225 [Acinetobacter junii]RBA47133.1 hypothetical protein DC346_09095 [Acinetobacter junii]
MRFLKRYWLLLLIILGIFIIQVLLYFNTFGNQHDFKVFFWENLGEKDWNASEDDGLEGKWGAFGDYMGGILNPILGFITIILLLVSHYKDVQRDVNYHKQREIDLLLMRIHKLIEMHNNNIDGFSIDDKSGNPKLKGKFIFSALCNLIDILCEKFAHLKNKGLIEKDILTLCFTIVYYGRGESLKNILEINFSKLNFERDIKDIIDGLDHKISSNQDLELFNGFTITFGTYFRSLFHLVDTIHTNNLLNSEQKYELIKDIRSQMSNNEQELLLINTMTGLGNRWVADGLILEYKLARNIDRNHDFSGYKLENYILSIIEKEYSSLLPLQKNEIYRKYFER